MLTSLNDFVDIKGYEGLYSVSKKGDIYSYPKYRHKGKLLKKYLRKDGYEEVGLSKNKKRKTFSVHRLVGAGFIPNPEKLPEINHKDGNKQNNLYSNLEWATSSENQIHAIKNGLQKFTEKHRITAIKTGKINGLKGRGKPKKGKLSTLQIEDITIKYSSGISARKLGLEYKVDKGTILSAINKIALCYKNTKGKHV